MWNELFLVPFLTGLGLAVLLPLLGCYLRLRDEWLAALAYSHVAAAGALLALVVGLPPTAGGMAAAGLAGAGKRLFSRRLSGGASYAVLLLGGWAGAVLLAANHPMAERLGHALFDGQLYFSGSDQLSLVAIALVLALLLLRLLSNHLLLAHVYPDFFRVRGLRAWPTQGGFDLLAALLLALGDHEHGGYGSLRAGLHSPLAGLSPGSQLAFRIAAGARHRGPWLCCRLRAGARSGPAVRAGTGSSPDCHRLGHCMTPEVMLKHPFCTRSVYGFLFFQETTPENAGAPGSTATLSQA